MSSGIQDSILHFGSLHLDLLRHVADLVQPRVEVLGPVHTFEGHQALHDVDKLCGTSPIDSPAQESCHRDPTHVGAHDSVHAAVLFSDKKHAHAFTSFVPHDVCT